MAKRSQYCMGEHAHIPPDQCVQSPGGLVHYRCDPPVAGFSPHYLTNGKDVKPTQILNISRAVRAELKVPLDLTNPTIAAMIDQATIDMKEKRRGTGPVAKPKRRRRW